MGLSLPLEEELDRQLEELAHEASYLNGYSLNDSELSIDFTAVRNHSSTNHLEPSNPSGSKNYLKCILKRQAGQESDPLLPTHRPVSVPINTPREPSWFQIYLTLFLQFFWNYILPARIRRVVVNNQKLIMLIILAILVVIGFVLYFTGNLQLVGTQVKNIYCQMIHYFDMGSLKYMCKS